MLGIKSSGCFIIGIIMGFILALFVGTACLCYFNPDIKQKTLTRVEEIWSKIKSKVDGSIDAAKKAPTVEPEVPLGASSTSKPAGSSQGKPAAPAPPQSRPRIEIKLGI